MASVSEFLCKNCSDLDLRAIFAGSFAMEDGFISRQSDTSSRWAWSRTENCHFCEFIAKCSAYRTIVYEPPELDAQLEPQWLKREKLKWFGFENEDVILRLVFDTPRSDESWLNHSRSKTYLPHLLIGCTPVNAICGVEGRNGPIRVISSFVQSFDELRKKIEACQENHSCPKRIEGGELPTSIPNLLLIDCASRQVVPAPEPCSYLALSYVWGKLGKQKAKALKIGEKLASLPQTIEDAITVTSKLGFQYLWVDMYCIDQNDESHVGDQIRHMDIVYQRAQATLIAAAGDSPDFGLPGVSSARQIRQAHIAINGVSLANFNYNPWELVDSSTWNSRAWTFQESLFSPRRIFFTTEQMIYNCSSGWNCESVALTQRPTLDSDNRCRIYRNWMVRPAPPIFQHYSTNAIYLLIREYSSRQLSFSRDILNAFSGVLHAYENLASPVKNLWGVPVLPMERSVLESVNMGLAWEFSATKAPPTVRRRRDFPSWSWIGWECPVIYKDWYTTRTEYFPMHESKVAVEITEGTKTSWVDVQLAVLKGQPQLCISQYLRLEAWTIPVVLDFSIEETEEITFSSFRRAYAVIGREGHCNKFRAQVPLIDYSVELDRIQRYRNAYRCTGILLGGFRETNDALIEHPLLLVTARGALRKRVGVAYLTELFKVETLCVDPLCVDQLCFDPPCDFPWCNYDHSRKSTYRRASVTDWIINELQLSRELIYLA